MKEKVIWDWTKSNNKEEEGNTNRIKEKKYTEVNIRKIETQDRNEGSFEEFIESEKKRRARYKKHW